MTMVFCRGCGKEIHETANSCPNCGAPQIVNSVNNPIFHNSTNINIDNTLVWVLAFAPIIGSILEGAIAYIIHGSQYRAVAAVNSGYYFWVTLLLNIALCVLDEKNLKKINIDTGQFGSAFLVPVYLFKRAKILGHNPPVYFIVWIVCFTISIIN